MRTHLTDDDYKYLDCITWLPLYFPICLLNPHHFNGKFLSNICFKVFIYNLHTNIQK